MDNNLAMEPRIFEGNEGCGGRGAGDGDGG